MATPNKFNRNLPAAEELKNLQDAITKLTEALEESGLKNFSVKTLANGDVKLGARRQNGDFASDAEIDAAAKAAEEKLGMNKKSAFLQMSGTGTARLEEPLKAKSRFIESTDAENERIAEEAAVEEQKRQDAKKRDDAFLEELEAERQRADQDQSNDEEIGAVDMGGDQAPEPKNKSKFITEEDTPEGDKKDEPEQKEENQLKEDILDLEGCDDTYKTYLSTLANFGMGSPKEVHNIMNGMLAGDFYDRIAKDEENGESKIKYKNGKVFVEYEQGGKLVVQILQKQGEEPKVSIGFKGGKFTQSAANDIILQHKARGSSGPLKLRGSRDQKQKMWLAAQAAGIAIDDSSFKPKKKDWKALQKYKGQLSVEQTVAGAVEAEVPGISPEVENKIIGIHEKLNAGLVKALNAFDIEKMAKIEAVRTSFLAFDENGRQLGIREDLTAKEIKKIDKALGKDCKKIDKGMEAAGVESESEFISKTLNHALGPIDQIIAEGSKSDNKQDQAKAAILQSAIQQNIVGLIAHPEVEKRYHPLAAVVKTAEPLHQAMQQEGNKVDNMLEALGVQDIDGLVQSMTGDAPEANKTTPENTAAAVAGFGEKAAERKKTAEFADNSPADFNDRVELADELEQLRAECFNAEKKLKQIHKKEFINPLDSKETKDSLRRHNSFVPEMRDQAKARLQNNQKILAELARDLAENTDKDFTKSQLSRIRQKLKDQSADGDRKIYNRDYQQLKDIAKGKAISSTYGEREATPTPPPAMAQNASRPAAPGQRPGA